MSSAARNLAGDLRAKALALLAEAEAAEEAARQSEAEWYNTDEAAAYLRSTPGAVRKAIARGSLKPDCHGGRGRTRSHRFHVETLRAYLGRGTPAT